MDKKITEQEKCYNRWNRNDRGGQRYELANRAQGARGGSGSCFWACQCGCQSKYQNRYRQQNRDHMSADRKDDRQAGQGGITTIPGSPKRNACKVERYHREEDQKGVVP